MLKTKIKADMKKSLPQYILIFIIIFIGLASYTSINSYKLGISQSIEDYYDYNHLQDINAYGSYNEHDLKRIKEYEEVKDANVILTLPDLAIVEDNENHKIYVNFLLKNTVSVFNVVDGEDFAYRRKGVWVDSYYAKENNLKVGDSFNFIYDNYLFKEKILGLVNTPDKVYDVQNKIEILPNHKEYGYVYLSKHELPNDIIKKLTMKKYSIYSEDEFNKKFPNFNRNEFIRYNKIIVELFDKEKYDDVKEKIESRIHTISVVRVEEEDFYKMYQSEVKKAEIFATFVPNLFIFMSLIIIIITIDRIIKSQKRNIGILKSLGYKNRRIILNYILANFRLCLITSLIGIIFGYFLLGNYFLHLEMKFYEVPNYHLKFDINSLYVGLFMTIFTCIITYISIKKVVKLNISELLKLTQNIIKSKKLNKTKNEKFNNLEFLIKWNIRDIIMNKTRTLILFVGLLLCSTSIVCIFGIDNIFENNFKSQFNYINNYKYKLNINKLDSELEKKYKHATSQNLQINLVVNKQKVKNTMFIVDAKDYIRLVDKKNNIIKIKDNGIYITEKLAKKYKYKIGDNIKIDIGDSSYKLKIIGLNKSLCNQNITISRKYYEKLKLNYSPDSLYTKKDVVKDKNKQNVTSIQSMDGIQKSVIFTFNTIEKNILIFKIFMLIYIIIIMYNIQMLLFSEKNYEITILKSLGYDFKQISKIYIRQNIWIIIFSTLFGLPLGYAFTNYLISNSICKNCDLIMYISTKTYFISILIIFLISYLTLKLISFKIKNINVNNLKES